MSDPDASFPVPKPSLSGATSPAHGLSAVELTDSQIQGALTPSTGSTHSGFRGWQPPTVEELQQMLPQYKVQQFIARGGMGAVYKGCQQSLDRVVAIKIFPPDIEDKDVHYAERFKQEAKAMAKLRHPGIVAVHDAGETADGLLYFVMEFIEGTDVAQMVAAQGTLQVAQALAITAQVCDALGYAHGRGIVHRDIKPSNIMIEPDGTVKVADFGLAKLISQDCAVLTRSEMKLGTPDFIAPEALIPGVKVDARADLYAMGVMLYQMLTGHIPRGRFKLPSGIVHEMDPRLDAIVDKAMQTDRELRYASATEMKADVERITKERDLPSAVVETKTGFGKSRSLKKPLLIIAAGITLIAGGWFVLKMRNGSVTSSATAQASQPASPEPAGTDGFRPLFDGSTLVGWRALNHDGPATNWSVTEGSLTGTPRSCLMTQAEFGDFDLRLEWRVAPGGNGGIYYRISEDGMFERPMKAVEFNLMDDSLTTQPLKATGAAFDVQAPAAGATHPTGEWNTARLLVQGSRVEHWINDRLVCHYDLADPATRDALQRAGVGNEFSAVKKGRIALQAWTGDVFYRNVRISEAAPAAAATPAPSPTNPPRNEWIKLLDSPDAVARSGIPGLVWQNGWLPITRERIYLLKLAGEMNDVRNVSFRATVRPAANPVHITLEMRLGSHGQYNLDIFTDRLVLRRVTIEPPGAKPEYIILKEVPLLQKSADGAFKLECGIYDDQISVKVDGRQVMDVRDELISRVGKLVVAAGTDEHDAMMKDMAIKLLYDVQSKVIAVNEPATETHGRIIDLLPLVDVKRDVIAGEWALTPDGLALKDGRTATNGEESPRLQLPYAPLADYDFEVEFTATTENPGNIGQIVLAASRNPSWVLAGGKNQKAAGFELFDNKPCSQSIETAKQSGGGIEKGRRYRSRVEVRSGSLRAFLDEKEIVNWNGDLKRLTNDAHSALRDHAHLGLRAGCGIIFHKVEVREISGPGSPDWVARTASAPAPPRNEWIKLLDTPEAVARSGINNPEWKDGWLTLVPERLHLVRLAGGKDKVRDMAFRATVHPPTNEWPVTAILHAGTDPQYNLDVHHDYLMLKRVAQVASSKPMYTELGNVPLDLRQSKDGAFRLEVSIQGNIITIMADGVKVIEVRDEGAAGAGDIALAVPSVSNGSGKIKDLAIRLLDDTSGVMVK